MALHLSWLYLQPDLLYRGSILLQVSRNQKRITITIVVEHHYFLVSSPINEGQRGWRTTPFFLPIRATWDRSTSQEEAGYVLANAWDSSGREFALGGWGTIRGRQATCGHMPYLSQGHTDNLRPLLFHKIVRCNHYQMLISISEAHNIDEKEIYAAQTYK